MPVQFDDCPIATQVLHSFEECRSSEGSPQAVVLALSGGPDSQVLLHAVHRVFQKRIHSPRLLGVGIDHGLRHESQEELENAGALCARLGVPFQMRAVNLKAGSGLMERARILRYKILQQCAGSFDSAWIALGHHQDDLIETSVFRMTRGCEPDSLLGMTELGRGRWRPLLKCSRQDILNYATRYEIPYRLDPTNQDTRFLRNHIRHTTLPALYALNDQAPKHMGRLLQQIEQDSSVLSVIAEERAHRYVRHPFGLGLGLADLCVEQPVALSRRIAKRWLQQYIKVPLHWVEKLTERPLKEGSCITIQDLQFLYRRGVLWALHPPHTSPSTEAWNVDWHYPPFGWSLSSKPKPGFFVEKAQETKLHFRAMRSDDRIHIGKNKHKRLNRLMIDYKIPRPLRPWWPVLADAAEQTKVVWVPEVWIDPDYLAASGWHIDGALPWNGDKKAAK